MQKHFTLQRSIDIAAIILFLIVLLITVAVLNHQSIGGKKIKADTSNAFVTRVVS